MFRGLVNFLDIFNSFFLIFQFFFILREYFFKNIFGFLHHFLLKQMQIITKFQLFPKITSKAALDILSNFVIGYFFKNKILTI